VAITFGKVPHPPFEDRYIPDSQTSAWNDLGPRRALGVCQHSMVGSLIGTDKWFRDGVPSPTHKAKGLTDYGIGGSTDGPLDGVIWRWNDPTGRRSGWASGGSDGLEGDGPAFVAKLGVDAINRDLVSIERSDGGDIATPMSPRQFESICQLSAYWFDQAKVPWDSFPVNPHYGIVTHMLHKEFATKDCPFPAVYDRINEIQDRIRAILKQYQESAGYAPVVGLPFDHLTETGWHDLNGVDVYLIKATVECIKRAIPRAYASGTAAQTADAVAVRDVIPIFATFKSGDGVQWFLMEDGSRIRASSFTPAIAVKKR
jgi:hypothetical protein